MAQTFHGKSLEEVYEKASIALKCSITDLNIDIVQFPSKGFFGFFSKEAIIRATVEKKNTSFKNNYPHKEKKTSSTTSETLSSRLQALKEEEKHPSSHKPSAPNIKQIEKEKIFEDFYTSETQELHKTPKVHKENQVLINEIKREIENLFSKICYEIDEIKVDIIENNQTVLVEFNGEDSALLIGKEGYRYKALSYILFNWINEKYGMMLRLEIAQFLQNQEISIHSYLEPVIETIKTEGFFKTKPLDGILIHIALTKLREEFPNKYVAVKTNLKGEKYILVNDYRN